MSTLPPRTPAAREICAATARGVARWGYFAALMLPPLLTAGYAAHRFAYFYNHYGPVAATYRSRWAWLLALLLAFLALALCLRARWRRQACLTLKNKTLHISLPPRQPRTLAWEDIAGVSLHLHRQRLPSRGWRGHITLHTTSGKRIRLDGRFPNLPALAEELQRRWYAARLPHLRQAWQRGETLAFGKIHVAPAGLHTGNTLHPWRRVRQVGIAEGRLVIELTTNRTERISLARVHNPHALLWWLYEEAKR